MFKNKLVPILLSLALLVGVATPALASSDGLGFSQTIGASYATLNVGPFTGSLSIASLSESYTPHALLGLSVPACCGNIYTGGVGRFNFDEDDMGFVNLNLFAGYEFSIDPAILKFEFGPKINGDTVFYDLHTYEWGLTFRILFNPIDMLDMYACGEGDPCQLQNNSGG